MSAGQRARDGEEWWPTVAVVHTEWHDTRALAEKGEAEAIKAEQPLHNRVHNGRQYRYRGHRFPASQLHPIAREHFGDRPFSYRDLTEELSVPSGTVAAYGNRLMKQGAFRVSGSPRGFALLPSLVSRLPVSSCPFWRKSGTGSRRLGLGLVCTSPAVTAHMCAKFSAAVRRCCHSVA
ncbi:hypothetical protein ASD08_30830 [Streptomyces sp. Root369]|nr:hypothetical protein ASD08_30830 [Streptomyces sp. Root369]